MINYSEYYCKYVQLVNSKFNNIPVLDILNGTNINISCASWLISY